MERVLGGDLTHSEREQEAQLRPQNFKEFIGQKKVVDNIDLMVKSALVRKAAMDHVLLSGPPGLGKTTISTIIAHEMASAIKSTSGPAIEKQSDIVSLLTSLTE